MDPAGRPSITPEINRCLEAFTLLDRSRVRPHPISMSDMLAFRDMVGLPFPARTFIKVVQALDNEVNQEAWTPKSPKAPHVSAHT